MYIRSFYEVNKDYLQTIMMTIWLLVMKIGVSDKLKNYLPSEENNKPMKITYIRSFYEVNQGLLARSLKLID